MTSLYQVGEKNLTAVPQKTLASEEQLEAWIANDPSIIGLDMLVLGRQVVTDFGSRIDILGIGRDGDLWVIELKRDRTPRDVVGQILDYASWAARLSTKEVHDLAMLKLGERLEVAFQRQFDSPLPEDLNGGHSMVIVASEFDASSKRIVAYLAEEYDVSINTAFFDVFELDGKQLLATEWLMDQQEVIERAEGRRKLPWTGYFYVNSGHDPSVRDWEDMREFGFVSAGYGRHYSGKLEQLSPGDSIYVYQPGAGYIGYGTVRSSVAMSKDFELLSGEKLVEIELRQEAVLHDPESVEDTDYIVGVDWIKTVPITEAKTFPRRFANQNIVCKLRDPATLDFLAQTFGSDSNPTKSEAF